MWSSASLPGTSAGHAHFWLLHAAVRRLEELRHHHGAAVPLILTDAVAPLLLRMLRGGPYLPARLSLAA